MRNISNFFKVLFMMYFVTLILLLLLALIMYKMEPGEMLFQVWLIAVYVISGFAGGFLIGKCMKNQKFLWGLGVGAAYFAILLVVSLLLHSGLKGDVTHILTTFVLCAASGTIGGMVS